MEDYNDPDWWRRLPCHFNSEWNLHGESELDVRKLKHQVKDDLRSDPKVMRVENLLYQAFLEIPPKSFLRFELRSPQSALTFLKEAEDFIEITMPNNIDAKNGYGIVINSLRMWVFGDRGNTAKREKTEGTLKKLNSSQNEKSHAFVNAIRAVALSRLGLKRCEEAMTFFEIALRQFPNNTDWMFGKAIMQGRLARSARSTLYGSRNLNDTLIGEFEKEREFLQQILEKEPNFAWPMAYLGQCLYNLNRSEEAFKFLDQAMSIDKRNTDIALISARVYKWDKQFLKCEKILKDLPEESKTAEVFLQLGLSFGGRARKLSQSRAFRNNSNQKILEHRKLLKKALEYIEKALDKDICHIAAANKMAELRSLLGEKEEAKKLYLDLLQREDTLPLNQFHIRRSANLKHVKEVFDKSDVLDNIFKMLDLCITNFTTFDMNGIGEFNETVKKDAENFLCDLEEMSNDESYEDQNLAKKFLAQVKRRMGKNRVSITLILSLIDKPGMDQTELRWNLGKCYCSLGEMDKAECEARTLSELPPKRRFPAEEIFADVYLAIAKTEQTSKKDVKYMIENLQKAITKGSIEACYVYLTKSKHAQMELCSLEEPIAQTIAKIEACLERSDKFHEKFADCPNDPIDFIQKRIRNVLSYPVKTGKNLPEDLKKRYNELFKMRRYLLDFEGCYLQLTISNRVSWNKVCQKAAEKVLIQAKEILDHVIFDYQKKVHKEEEDPKSTAFPVHMDWNQAETDENILSKKFEGYLSSKFPRHDMPDEMKTFFKELQPLHSRDNLWLPAMCNFTGKKRHTGTSGDDDDEFHYIVLKCADDIPYKKVDLVRRSCYQVEQIVQKLLEFIEAQFYPDTEDKEQSSISVHV